MKRLVAVTLAAFLIFGCVSAPSPKPEQAPVPEKVPEPEKPKPVEAAKPTPPPEKVPEKPAVDPAALASYNEMKELFGKAQDALDNYHLTEAIKSCISMFASFESVKNPLPESTELAAKANAELTKIGSRLSIEPGPEWVDSSGNQMAPSTRTVGKEKALNPVLFLWENYGTGKTPVVDAPISFEFVKNSGSLTGIVTTDAQGKANTNLQRLDTPGESAVIRAYPLFRAKGVSYAFKNVYRDFTYLPPANTATVLVMERSELGPRDNPQIVDTIGTRLKTLGLVVNPLNGGLLGDGFMLAIGGDGATLSGLSKETKSAYFAFVLSDCYSIKQVMYNGKAYNLFQSLAKATLRIVRQDGTIVHSIPVDGIRGDGGSKEAAADKAFKLAGQALLAEFEKQLPAIKLAIEKE